MRLTDLQPQFLRHEVRMETYQVVDGDPDTWRERGCPTRDVTGPRMYMPMVDKIEEAQGVEFLCPKCFAANGGPVGTHIVVCWSRSRGVPDDASPGPGRWMLDGTGYSDLTLNADPPGGARSVLLTAGCGAHFHVTAGEVA
jgi:hypothetical protein